MLRFLGTTLVLVLCVPLRSEAQKPDTARSPGVERLATVAVHSFPQTGYVIIKGPADWHRFRDRHTSPGGLDSASVRLDFTKGPVLGVITTASGCHLGPLVHDVEGRGDTLYVILQWEPNQWGPCQSIKHGGELVQLRSDPKEIRFFHTTASDSLNQVMIHQVDLR